MARKRDYPETPDGRYFVAKGRLWRKSNPSLNDTERRAAIKALMQARRRVFTSESDEDEATARADVDAAKRRLGERGPVWWTDGAPDEGGRHPKNSSYAGWWASLSSDGQKRAEGRA